MEVPRKLNIIYQRSLLSKGAISQNKINLIYGMVAAQLLDILFIFAGKEAVQWTEFLIVLAIYIMKAGKQKC